MKTIIYLFCFFIFNISPSVVYADVGGFPGVKSFSDMYTTLVGTDIGMKGTLGSISGILNALVPLMIVVAGLILFLMLLSGGFQLLTSATNPDSAEKGKQKITNALIGFIIIFTAYWITQIIEIVLGVKILGP